MYAGDPAEAGSGHTTDQRPQHSRFFAAHVRRDELAGGATRAIPTAASSVSSSELAAGVDNPVILIPIGSTITFTITDPDASGITMKIRPYKSNVDLATASSGTLTWAATA